MSEPVTIASISVVIPTYYRPVPLKACIESLLAGTKAPREIIVVAREGDDSTEQTVREFENMCAEKTDLRIARVSEPGHVPPIKKGLDLANSEIVAFVDDDVTVTPNWLENLVVVFSDPEIGVVGGCVVAPKSAVIRRKGNPGCITWYGRIWGNLGTLNSEHPVDVNGVMEGNWAWRRSLLKSIGFDPVLNFDDASMYGLDLCLQARRQGFRVVYEPRAIVYHHAAPRAPELDRADRPRRTFSYTRNYTYIMLRNLPWWRRPIFLLWWFLIGERGSWGLAAVLADTFTGRPPRLANVLGAWKGKVEGLRLAAIGTGSNV